MTPDTPRPKPGGARNAKAGGGDRLGEMLQIRNSLVQCATIKDVVHLASETACHRIGAQSAAVFLLSKRGTLRRVAISGTDVDGAPIPDDWYPEEEYRIGESFTGKVLVPDGQSEFGQPISSHDLAHDQIHDTSRTRYLDLLGHLDSAVSVPLSGPRKTFGALEVIEHALAHQLKDKAEAAYARGTLFDKRRSLMADWAQFCDTEITSIQPRP